MNFTDYWAQLEQNVVSALEKDDSLAALDALLAFDRSALNVDVLNPFNWILQEGTAEQLMTYISWLIKANPAVCVTDFSPHFMHPSHFVGVHRHAQYFTSLCE